MKIIFGSVLLMAILFVGGCAGLDVTPLTTGEESKNPDSEARGFRYYRSSPFLLIYTDNKGGLVTKVLYLPDMTKKMSIRPYNYLASNNTTLKFDKGRLTQAKAVVDETVIPTAVVSGLEKVASALFKAASAPSTSPEFEVPAPYLFRIANTEGKWALKGGQGLGVNGERPTVIRVTVIKEEKNEKEETTAKEKK